MTREEVILSHIKRDGRGLEIGAGHAPIAPKRDGFRVQILDHCDTATLIEKLERHSIKVDRVEEVDFVWDGRPYPEIIGATKLYDWIIASHVIEHTTDLVGFLHDCDSLLKENGVLSLAVPDIRHCFDRFRPITGIGRVIDAAGNTEKIHSVGTAAEFYLSMVRKGGQIAWDATEAGTYEFVYSLAEAEQAMRDVSERGQYLDVHEWCFTPTSFRLMMRDLFDLGLIQLKELAFYPTQGCEFYIVLSRTGTLPVGTRMELLQQILREQSVA